MNRGDNRSYSLSREEVLSFGERLDRNCWRSKRLFIKILNIVSISVTLSDPMASGGVGGGGGLLLSSLAVKYKEHASERDLLRREIARLKRELLAFHLNAEEKQRVFARLKGTASQLIHRVQHDIDRLAHFRSRTKEKKEEEEGKRKEKEREKEEEEEEGEDEQKEEEEVVKTKMERSETKESPEGMVDAGRRGVGGGEWWRVLAMAAVATMVLLAVGGALYSWFLYIESRAAAIELLRERRRII